MPNVNLILYLIFLRIPTFLNFSLNIFENLLFHLIFYYCQGVRYVQLFYQYISKYSVIYLKDKTWFLFSVSHCIQLSTTLSGFHTLTPKHWFLLIIKKQVRCRPRFWVFEFWVFNKLSADGRTMIDGCSTNYLKAVLAKEIDRSPTHKHL